MVPGTSPLGGVLPERGAAIEFRGGEDGSPDQSAGQAKQHTNGRWYAERVVCVSDGAEIGDALFDGPCMKFFESEEAQTAAEDYARRLLTLARYVRAWDGER